MLRHIPLRESIAPIARQVELLQLARETIAGGMASIDEYGDMLKWGLQTKNGFCRYVHVFHPGFCSFSDQFFGTIHYHGGIIRGTVLAGELEHYTYDPVQDAAGDRFHDDTSYRLSKHTHVQPSGTHYELAPFVPHWLAPTGLTVTYFEEEDNGVMGELVNPATKETDEYLWEQADADARMDEILALIDARLRALSALPGTHTKPLTS